MENEKRLIYLDKLVEHFRRTKIDEVFPEWKDLGWLTRSAVLRLTTKYRAIILNAPVVDAVEVVHGKWEKAEYNGFLRCDQCKDVYINEEWLEDGKWNHCPNCGAKMDGDGNED